jgi:hypothetical protein
MPKEGEPLTDEQIDALARWIGDGAPKPAVTMGQFMARDFQVPCR